MEVLQISLAAARVNAEMTQEQVAEKCKSIDLLLEDGKREIKFLDMMNRKNYRLYIIYHWTIFFWEKISLKARVGAD